MICLKMPDPPLAQGSSLVRSIHRAVPALHARRRQRNSDHRKSKNRLMIVLTIKYLCIHPCVPCGKNHPFFSQSIDCKIDTTPPPPSSAPPLPTHCSPHKNKPLPANPAPRPKNAGTRPGKDAVGFAAPCPFRPKCSG